jgi:radical SAM protein with 4Fe4S-binding SPASM domain
MLRPAFMKLENYKTMFDQVKDYALSVALYNWGEPFLNKQIFDMIDYTRSQKVGTTIHSNLNHFNESMADDIVKSGLTHLYLSIDGATQEVYSQYRVKGHIEQVIHNAKVLVAARKKANSKLPLITWKYLVFPFNKHEVEKASKMAKEIGVDNFEVFDAVIKLTDIYDEAENYRKQPVLLKTLSKPCKSLWASIYLEPGGTVFPCSLSFRENESFGNALDKDFKQVWNNAKYKAARGLFNLKPELDNIPNPCKGCKYYLKCTQFLN